MANPTLLPADVSAILPNARNVVHVGDGGQKTVFRAEIGGIAYAIKFLRPTVQHVATSEVADDVSVVDDVTARATREVETLRQCHTPYLVKPGPIGLTAVEVKGEQLLYFTEEFIDGEVLTTFLGTNGPLNPRELVRLGTHMTLAIQELWNLSKIHRDVKPGNIMRRRASGEFVLLDMGLVFDLDDRSFSLGPVEPSPTFLQNKWISRTEGAFSIFAQTRFRSGLFFTRWPQDNIRSLLVQPILGSPYKHSNAASAATKAAPRRFTG